MTEHLDIETRLIRAGIAERGTKWTPSRKVEIINLIRDYPHFKDRLKERFLLTEAELLEWRTNYERGGLEGLRTKRIPSAKDRSGNAIA